MVDQDAMREALVEFENVGKRYGAVHALRDITFDVRAGEVFGYIGPNGAGKTTTLRILVGLLRSFAGSVSIAGRKVGVLHQQVHDLIGFLPQSVGFHEWRTAEAALFALGELSGMTREAISPELDRLLTRFSLNDSRHKKVKQLSGGMRQKLGFVQAMLHRPKLLVLDEPLSSLDPASRNVVKEVIREVRAEGTTVIFSSHILSDVEDLADRIGVVRKGSMVATGTLDELKRQFGAPMVVAVEFAAPPSDDSFLDNAEMFVGREQVGKTWRVQLRDGQGFDAGVHHIIEGTLAAGGRIRGIHPLDPDLDELYVRYVDPHGEGHEDA
ncbi:MAG: ABC transporter ATP-binding protein [Nannocystaceae bacterium]|nr:ABC transporter ATP-binding protein [Nannocystaceae bacterium]